MCQLNLHVLIIEYYGIFVAYLFAIFIDLNTDQKALIILVFKFKVNCLQTNYETFVLNCLCPSNVLLTNFLNISFLSSQRHTVESCCNFCFLLYLILVIASANTI